MKTAMQELIDYMGSSKDLTQEGKLILREAKRLLEKEKKQIMDAVDEGIKYGNSSCQTFDYPSSRYYSVTFNNKHE